MAVFCELCRLCREAVICPVDFFVHGTTKLDICLGDRAFCSTLVDQVIVRVNVERERTGC